MSHRLNRWKAHIFDVGLFIIFLVTFGDYVWGKVWPIIRPLFRN